MKRSLVITVLFTTLAGCGNPQPEVNTRTTAPSPIATSSQTKSTLKTQEIAAVPSSQQCQISAYVIDPDPRGVNVRSQPNSTSKIVDKLPTTTAGVTVDLVASQGNWVQISKAESPEKTVFSGSGWIYAQLLGTSTRGYGSNGVNAYASPNNKSKVVSRIPPSTSVKLLSCNGSYAKVEYKGIRGWLTREAQCSNPLSTCS